MILYIFVSIWNTIRFHFYHCDILHRWPPVALQTVRKTAFCGHVSCSGNTKRAAGMFYHRPAARPYIFII